MTFTTGNNSIDALARASWNDAPGSGAALTFSFLETLPADATRKDAFGFMPMTEVQRSAAREALSVWSTVANVSFTEVANDGNVQLGSNDQSAVNSNAYAYYPKANGTAQLFLSTAVAANTSFAIGSKGWETMLHEIGHNLGLKHPGDYDSSGFNKVGPWLPEKTDNNDYSVMSYNNGFSYKQTKLHSATPMVYDIQALQYLYGANTSYRTGDDVYHIQASDAPFCIWDAGGSDTLDFSACSQASSISLRAGGFSASASGVTNVSIAYGVTIESVIAGSGDAKIYANDAGNSITGGTGDDVIYVGAGNDRIDGGAGADTVMFKGNFADYAISAADGKLFIDGEGHDILSAVETIKFHDLSFKSGTLERLLEGSTGDDRLAGHNDRVIGGRAGVDTVVYEGALANFALADSGASWTVTLNANQNSWDRLFDVERLQFSDAAVALDTDGHAGQAYRLYQATFDRAPDLPGLGFWINHMDHGMTIEEMAGHFMNSDEFGRSYGKLSNEAFITQLYRNALHREPEAAGLAFHLNNLEHGMSRAIELVGFSESDENQAQVIGQIAHGITYLPFA
ncbi:DUF4214 domain-containing protein [Oxalobacteraceae bacterium]|nr:DUF4214 domain-containing protein [Oxalobacteraceae bacterium]